MKLYIGLAVVAVAIIGLVVDYVMRKPAATVRASEPSRRPDKLELLMRIADLTVEVSGAIADPGEAIEHLNAVYVAVVKAK